MTFDLKKAMENGGKCVVGTGHIKRDAVIIYDKFKHKGSELVVVTHYDNSDDFGFYALDGVGKYESHLENVPESREVFIAMTNRGIVPFRSFDELGEYCESMSATPMNIYSTGKMTLTDGEFIKNE